MAAPRDTMSAELAVPVTLGSSVLANGECKAIWVNTAGTANLTFPNGQAATSFPLKEGLNPLRVTVIDAPSSGTAATGVWALY